MSASDIERADCSDVLEALLAAVRASRVTLREDVPGPTRFPVTCEALANGISSLKAETTVDLTRQPVVGIVLRGRQVVQDDCRAALDDPKFHELLDRYGGLAAQIVTPIVVDGSVVAILSLHQLGAPRSWTNGEVDACTEAATRLGERLRSADAYEQGPVDGLGE